MHNGGATGGQARHSSDFAEKLTTWLTRYLYLALAKWVSIGSEIDETKQQYLKDS